MGYEYSLRRAVSIDAFRRLSSSLVSLGYSTEELIDQRQMTIVFGNPTVESRGEVGRVVRNESELIVLLHAGSRPTRATILESLRQTLGEEGSGPEWEEI